MDKSLYEVLACPLCKGRLLVNNNKQELVCKFDRIAYPIRDGIPVMLEHEGRTLTVDECSEL